MTGPETGRRLSCPKCGSAEVALSETTYEHHNWFDGVMLVEGELRPLGEAIHRTGDIDRRQTALWCQDCKHRWRPRRPVGMPY